MLVMLCMHMNPHARLLVGWLVSRSVIISKKVGKLHFHALIEHLVMSCDIHITMNIITIKIFIL